MAHSFLVFDFGKNEEAAQQGRHKLETWKQAFHLGNKILLKFDREGSESSDGESAAAKKKASAKSADAEKSEASSRIRLLLRLDFSDHEKLSHQRWLDRIPTEEPFKSFKAEIVRVGDPEFSKTAERFDSLD